MERVLWQAERLTEFGPNPFSAEDEPGVVEVRGARPRPLKLQVQSKCENIPGVYGFVDKDGVLIYVGKSKTLRSRLLSYFSPKVRNQKQGRMIRLTRGILWEPAPSEFAALLRELQLIQHWRPRFNVRDMPQRTRPTFLCLGRPTAPGVMLSSKPASSMLAAFGPVFGSQRLTRAVEALNRLFLLRDCANSQPMGFADQTRLFTKDDRPGCLRFEMQNCLGPCVSACSKSAYFNKVKAARRFLEGRDDALLAKLAKRMEDAAIKKQYELAARIRDDLEAVMFLRERLDRVRAAEEDYHFVYPVPGDEGKTLWYLIRGGRVAAVISEPQTPASAKAARGLLGEIFAAGPIPEDLAARRPDTLLLVTSWFQQNPAEFEKTLSPAEAKKRCRAPRPR